MLGLLLFLTLQISEEAPSTSFPVEVRGVAKIAQDIRIYQYRVKGGAADKSTRCVNAYFARPARFGKRIRRLNGRHVVIRGTALDYFAMTAEDPIAATISRFQNECGNRLVIVIKSIELAK